MHNQCADVRIVVDARAVDRHETYGIDLFGREVLRGLGLLLLVMVFLFCVAVVCGMQHRDGHEQHCKPTGDAANASYLHRSLP
jgi:hypothetical protein